MKRGYTRQLIDVALSRKGKAGKATEHGKTQLTIETHKVVLVHRRGGFQIWCTACAATVEMVTPEMAAAILQISLRRVFRRVEAETLHGTETADGLLFICRRSLTNLSQEVIRK